MTGQDDQDGFREIAFFQMYRKHNAGANLVVFVVDCSVESSQYASQHSCELEVAALLGLSINAEDVGLSGRD